MKIETASDYLKYRAIVLGNEHDSLTMTYEDNKLRITEIRKKIDEIKSIVDEGFEMFSPRGAQEKKFNKQEVKELQMKLLIIVDESKELQNQIDIINNELTIINSLISLYEENSEDINNTSNCLKYDEEIYNKLKLCADIVESDPRRVKIELNNLIDKNT